MKDGMRNASDVLVHREPFGNYRRIERRIIVLGIQVPIEVPRRVHERIHGVALALRRAAAPGAGNVHERRDVGQRRTTLASELDVMRKDYRQVGFGNRNGPALGTMDDRDGSAPIALPRNTPILQAERDRGFAESLTFR